MACATACLVQRCVSAERCVCWSGNCERRLSALIHGAAWLWTRLEVSQPVLSWLKSAAFLQCLWQLISGINLFSQIETDIEARRRAICASLKPVFQMVAPLRTLGDSSFSTINN